MNIDQRVQLWNDLQNFWIDDPQSVVPFSKRLAQERGWTKEFTDRAIQEYRRFLFLAVVGDHQVTPSDIVDQVWHMHLLYTRSYWDHLCTHVIKKRLHHEPANAPKDEALFKQQYRKTLTTYARLIGHEPPADIWGKPDNL